MSKVRFVLNKKGLSRLMKSKPMKDILVSYAESTVQRLGEGYESDIYDGRFRSNASIGATTDLAKIKNYKHNTILKAVMEQKK